MRVSCSPCRSLHARGLPPPTHLHTMQPSPASTAEEDDGITLATDDAESTITLTDDQRQAFFEFVGCVPGPLPLPLLSASAPLTPLILLPELLCLRSKADRSLNVRLVS